MPIAPDSSLPPTAPPVSCARRRATRSNARGFTLVELMIVVALIGTICAMGIWTLSGSLRVQQTGDLARSISFAMARARSEAVGDGYQRRVSCVSTGCTLQVAGAQGMSAQTTWTNAGWSVYAGTQTQVWAIDANTDVAATTPASGPLTTAQTIVFYPDGTAGAATVFVTDVTNKRQFKVFVYRATGMSRIVDQW